ncbi:MAG: hypothetical protein H7269_03585, partial [Cellulomonas sp.]|nr:hypothetical protein [Cellulomonas sp.]
EDHHQRHRRRRSDDGPGAPRLVAPGLLLGVLGARLLGVVVGRRDGVRGPRRRRGTAGDGATRVTGGWDEVLDHARDLHRAAPPHATRREIAVGFAGVGAAAVDHRRRGAHIDDLSIGGAMAGLATRADALVFGRGEPNRAQVESYWVRVDAVTAAMRTAVPRRDRWRARWSVASLRARRSWARR